MDYFTFFIICAIINVINPTDGNFFKKHSSTTVGIIGGLI